jgi:hypothetical protein
MSFEVLDKIAKQESDNESAASMQKAKDKLFNQLEHSKKKYSHRLHDSIQTQKGGKDPHSTTTLPRSISGSS